MAEIQVSRTHLDSMSNYSWVGVQNLASKIELHVVGKAHLGFSLVAPNFSFSTAW